MFGFEYYCYHPSSRFQGIARFVQLSFIPETELLLNFLIKSRIAIFTFSMSAKHFFDIIQHLFYACEFDLWDKIK